MSTQTIINHTCRFSKHYYRTILRFSTIFFLLAGIVYSFIRGDVLIFPDERQYFAIATNLAKGHGFSLNGNDPTALFPALYPTLMAFFIKFGATIPILRSINFFFLSCVPYVIKSILRHEDSEPGTGLSTILMILYGVLFYTAGTLYPQTLFTLVLLLLVRCALDAATNIGYAIAFGVLCTILMLVHSSGAFIPPVVGIWIILTAKEKKNAFINVCVSAMVAIICLSPWVIRNYSVFHKFIPLTTHGGDTLYIGNNPHTSLSEWYNYTNNDFYKKVGRLPEAEQNQYYVEKTLEFWTEQPAAAIKLYVRKLIEYFNFYNHLFVSKEFGFTKKLIMFITYYPLLACLILRLISIKKIPLSSTEKLLLAIYLCSAFFYAIFIPRIRFRLPYDVILITHIGIMFCLVTGCNSQPKTHTGNIHQHARAPDLS